VWFAAQRRPHEPARTLVLASWRRLFLENIARHDESVSVVVGARDYGIEAVVEQEALGRLATVRLTRSSKLQAPVIDLLFASSGIEPEVVAEAERIELLPNLTIGVARTGHLIALKVLSRDDVTRPQDLVDLRALMRVERGRG